MGLLEKIFPKKPPVNVQSSFQTLTAYNPVFTSWQGAIYESELVRSAIDAKARHISKLKIDFAGSARPYLKTACKHAPNSFMTWSQFLYRVCTILEAQNTAFIVPVKDEYNRITGYFPALPSQAAIVSGKDNDPYLQYRFMTGDTASERLV